MTTDVSVTLSVVEGSHVRPPHALREMSRQAPLDMTDTIHLKIKISDQSV